MQGSAFGVLCLAILKSPKAQLNSFLQKGHCTRELDIEDLSVGGFETFFIAGQFLDSSVSSMHPAVFAPILAHQQPSGHRPGRRRAKNQFVLKIIKPTRISWPVGRHGSFDVRVEFPPRHRFLAII
jgi:hypothetical protein